MKIFRINKENQLEKNPAPILVSVEKINKMDGNFSRAETFFSGKLGSDWRERISESHGNIIPDIMVNNLEEILSSRCQSNINNAVEAFKLWGNEEKSHNLVGFFRLPTEHERHAYLKKHGILSNASIFAEIMSINAASKLSQSVIAHGAVSGLAMVGVTISSHVLLPVALLLVGMAFIGIKQKRAVPEELEKLKRYNEESEMPLSSFTDKNKVGLSIGEIRQKGAESFVEVEEIIKKQNIRIKSLLKFQSLQTLRKFADDFIHIEEKLKHHNKTLSHEQIGKLVIKEWKNEHSSAELLNKGQRNWFKHTLVELLLLASPISLEVFPVLEHAMGGLVDETTSRILLKTPEALAVAKESKSEHAGFGELSHSQNPERYRDKFKRFMNKPFEFKYNDTSIEHFHHAEVFKISVASKEDVIKNLNIKAVKNPVATAIEQVNEIKNKYNNK